MAEPTAHDRLARRFCKLQMLFGRAVQVVGDVGDVEGQRRARRSTHAARRARPAPPSPEFGRLLHAEHPSRNGASCSFVGAVVVGGWPRRADRLREVAHRGCRQPLVRNKLRSGRPHLHTRVAGEVRGVASIVSGGSPWRPARRRRRRRGGPPAAHRPAQRSTARPDAAQREVSSGRRRSPSRREPASSSARSSQQHLTSLRAPR